MRRTRFGRNHLLVAASLALVCQRLDPAIADCSFGSSDFTGTVECATGAAPQQLYLTWSSAPGATQYKLTWREPTLFQDSTIAVLGGSTLTYAISYNAVTFLKRHQNENILFNVTALGCGNNPQLGNYFFITPLLTTPTAVYAQDNGAGLVRVSWFPPGGQNPVADIYRDNEQTPFAYAIPWSDVHYDFAEPNCGSHTYKVLARSGECTTPLVAAAPWNESAQQPPATPVITYPLDGKTLCASADSLKWANSCGATSYNVQFGMDPDFEALIFSRTNVTGHSTSTGTVAASATYYWRVQAKNSKGVSAWAIATVTGGHLPVLPNDPAHVTRVIHAVDADYSSGYVYWNETSTIDVFPEPTDCPCSFNWQLMNGSSNNYTTSTTGNRAFAYNINVASNLTLNYQVTPTNAWGVAANYTGLGFALFAGDRNGGGCPYVGVLTGSGWIDENNLLPGCEFPAGGPSVSDWYAIQNTPMAHDGVYSLRLREFENERTHFEAVRVYAIDHPRGTRASVDDAGRATVWRLDHDVDLGFDAGRDLKAGSTVDLTDPALKSSGTEALMVQGASVEKTALSGWVDSDSPAPGGFAFREHATDVMIPLDRGVTASRLRLARGGTVDRVALMTRVAGDFPLQAVPIVRTSPGNEGARGAGSGGPSLDGLVLAPGDAVQFDVPVQPLAPGFERTLVIASTGRYVHLLKTAPASSSAAAGTPMLRVRPLGKSSSYGITFASGQPGLVRLSVFDLQGREVARLSDGFSAGLSQEAIWNAQSAPAGIYFARLTQHGATGGPRLVSSIRMVHLH